MALTRDDAMPNGEDIRFLADGKVRHTNRIRDLLRKKAEEGVVRPPRDRPMAC